MSSSINRLVLTDLPNELLTHIANLDRTNLSYPILRSVSRALTNALRYDVYRTSHVFDAILASSSKKDKKHLVKNFIRYAPLKTLIGMWAHLKEEKYKPIASIATKVSTLTFDLSLCKTELDTTIFRLLEIVNSCTHLYELSLHLQEPTRLHIYITGKKLRVLHMPNVLLPYKNLQQIVTKQKNLREATLSISYRKQLSNRLQQCENLKEFSFTVKDANSVVNADILSLLRNPLRPFSKSLTIHLPPQSSSLPPAKFIHELPRLILLCQSGLVEEEFRLQEEEKISSLYPITLQQLGSTVSTFTNDDLAEVVQLSKKLQSLQISIDTIDLAFRPCKVNRGSQLDRLTLILQSLDDEINPLRTAELILASANPTELILLPYPERYGQFARAIQIRIKQTENGKKVLVTNVYDEFGVVTDPLCLEPFSRLKRLILPTKNSQVVSKELIPFFHDCTVKDLQGNIHHCRYLDIEGFNERQKMLKFANWPDGYTAVHSHD